MASSAGSVQGRVPAGYTAVEELGSGRAGRAVLCRDAAERPVVVRMTGITGSGAAAFEAELRTVAAAASHPCAVTIPKVWTDPELGVCFEQTHCPGLAEGPLDVEVAAVGGVRLVAALAHAHRLGLLHGDLRPDDVMLDADGNWLLADGGILEAVRRARPDLAVDRDSLFSPRELRGWEAPAESADVYSLGATLRALLGDTPVEAEMDALLGRMLAPNPADRPSLVEVDEVLRAEVPSAARAALPIRPEGPRPTAVPPRPVIRVAPVQSVAAAASNRRRTMLVAASIGAVFVVGAGAVAVANSGSDHGGATAAAASASLAPSAAPSPGAPASAAANSGLLKPLIRYMQPKLHNGIYLAYVQWQMPSWPTGVQGWNIYAADPNNTSHAVKNGFYRSDGTAPMGTLAAQYFFTDKASVGSCARVDTVVSGASAPYQSSVVCPRDSDVTKAQTANVAAKKAAAKAAKKAAAKKG
jgi:hypothetical protein